MSRTIDKQLNQRYQVMEKLAKGGFGTTYLAKDELLNCLVAVKEIIPTTSDSKELDAFLLEAQIQSQFSQLDGVVSVKDYFCENKKGYLVMDYVDGVSVNEYVRLNGSIPVKDAFNLLKPVFSVLDEMHRQNWIHRDISADNLMITPHGDCKLIDFGSTRKYLDEKNVTMTVMFKQGFAAPEQYQDSGLQGPFTDVYGLCACLYFMLTGEKIPDAVHRLLKDDLKPINEYSIEGLTDEQCDAIMKGLSLHGEDRFDDIGSLFKILYQMKLPEKVSLHSSSHSKSKKNSISNSEINRLWKQIEKRKNSHSKVVKWGVAILALIIIAVIIFAFTKNNKPASPKQTLPPSIQNTPEPSSSVASGSYAIEPSATPASKQANKPLVFKIKNYRKLTKKKALTKLKTLKKAGLKIIWKKQYSSNNRKGTIIKQSINANKTFTTVKNKELILTVSLGAKPVNPVSPTKPSSSKTTSNNKKVDASIDNILY